MRRCGARTRPMSSFARSRARARLAPSACRSAPGVASPSIGLSSPSRSRSGWRRRGAAEGPRAPTSCGRPAYNSGDRAGAKAVARQVIAAFAGYDYVVAPSGSCAGMVKVHYVELFADEPETLVKAEELAARTHELVS